MKDDEKRPGGERYAEDAEASAAREKEPGENGAERAAEGEARGGNGGRRARAKGVVKERGRLRESVAALVSRAGKAVRDAVYPEDITCDVCGAELVAGTRYNLCAACTEEMPFIMGHRCLNCGLPVNDEADWCMRCMNTESIYLANRSPLVYEGKARSLVYALKFGGRKYIARLLGAMMSDTFLSCGMEGEIIVPVPMTEKDEKKRGFNQSELLARDIGERLNIPVLPALSKTKDTAPQKELSGRARRENVKGCFSAAYAEYLAGRRILLVDDVFTTGATANECARTLLSAGAASVSVLTAAVTKPRLAVEKGEDGAVEVFDDL